ncbi:hypothetical protein BHE74_00001137 [Ensete ventricosum]|nr:hypothetical protein GW17_00010985 [Ensete ventricosum]RWW89824.1 hypothetical protein BHE74_00001137 [Ensete ventricosum]
MSQLRYDVVPKRISSRSKAKFPVKVLSAVVKLYTVVGYYIRVNCGPVIKMKEEKAKSERQGSKAQAPSVKALMDENPCWNLSFWLD